MAISFDKAFGVHPQAMLIRSQRAELLASNIANADTPGYKAKDIDFASALKAAKSGQLSGNRLTTTHPEHLHASTQMNLGVAKYRVQNQSDTGDGNSVDVQVERNLYTQNAIEYQASLSFMTSKILGLKKALGGQGA
ncbi:flagellar basal body rod protein FlgB [Pseudoalteromonas sp. YIC-827]|uniref:Flagellar basal body rod protein FlgB n=1 Tax=Pseudoalteromonas qingdaonensis TaxID=3131913 RepID=A0ABU9N2S8_9GAMM